ncbi:MAG: S-layer homology domain-containing protein [Candidatus Gracilibacteria bacterium]|jgi:hypothetical protein|nr:S-layer homology domain-containing protein [Candidatus Gracilibacteria bacterium]
MKKSIGFVSLFVAFLFTSAISVYVFNNYMNENAESVLASVADFNPSESDLKAPISNLCDPFCIVAKEDGSSDIYFEDLESDHKNAYAISVFYDLGLIKGYSDGTFRPENNLNRAELLAIVLDSVDADFSGQLLENCFKDVKNEWFSAYVCYAKNHNIVAGYSDGNFKPGNNVTRAEALKITLSAFGFDIDEVPEDATISYNDAKISDWYGPYLYLGSKESIVSKDGRFNGGMAITRAEFVQLIYNTMHAKGLIQ